MKIQIKILINKILIHLVILKILKKKLVLLWFKIQRKFLQREQKKGQDKMVRKIKNIIKINNREIIEIIVFKI